jgi:hypothetical protein
MVITEFLTWFNTDIAYRVNKESNFCFGLGIDVLWWCCVATLDDHGHRSDLTPNTTSSAKKKVRRPIRFHGYSYLAKANIVYFPSHRHLGGNQQMSCMLNSRRDPLTG